MASTPFGPEEKPKRSRGSLSVCLLAAVLCLVWLAGCVSGILTRKGSQGDGDKLDTAAKLIKPRVTASAQGDTPPNDSRWKGPGKDGKQGDAVLTKPSLSAENLERSVSGDHGSRQESPEVKTSKGASLRGEGKTGEPESPGKNVEEKPAPESQTRDYRPEDEGSFKKHDHAQYVGLIEKKAREMLKEHRDATLARMCKDSTTDQWTMNIYHRDPKTYSFISYSWDEVDEKWEKSFESRKQPIARWQSHLNFTAARKTCRVIKGGLER